MDSYTDELTGCLSRKALEHALDTMQSPGHIAILTLNASYPVNEMNGYTVADEVIVAVAHRLREGVGDLGTVFSLGSRPFMFSEYVVLLPNLDAERSERLLVELLTAVAEVIASESERGFVSVAAGMAAVSPDGHPRKLGQADAALYRARRQGLPYTIFRPDDSE